MKVTIESVDNGYVVTRNYPRDECINVFETPEFMELGPNPAVTSVLWYLLGECFKSDEVGTRHSKERIRIAILNQETGKLKEPE